MSRIRSLLVLVVLLVVVAGLGAAYFLHGSESGKNSDDKLAPAPTQSDAATGPTTKLIVGEQAQKNLGIAAKPLKVEVFWKTVSMQGMVIDRPGFSDREVVAPFTGTVSELFHVPGDMVKPGDVLFTLKLASESLQQTQAELATTSEETKHARARLERLKAAGEGIAQSRIIDAQNEISRLSLEAQAYQQELRNRGLSQNEIENVANGKLLSEVPIRVPDIRNGGLPTKDGTPTPSNNYPGVSSSSPEAYEFQQLQVQLGEQVQAGQTLCHLTNHEQLFIEGRAFRDESDLLERSVQESWPVDVDFQEAATAVWPAIDEVFTIRYLSNMIDPTSRTFAFMMPLKNQYKTVNHGDRQQILWRFRPGQKVLLHVRTEEIKNVFVLPTEAVVVEGADAYVFTQNVNTFERKSVQLITRDRGRAVLANDSSLPTYKKGQDMWTIPAVVRNAAAQLNRMSKAGTGTSVPKGYHIHADGSLHKNEDESK